MIDVSDTGIFTLILS